MTKELTYDQINILAGAETFEEMLNLADSFGFKIAESVISDLRIAEAY